MSTIYLFRRKTAAAWTSANPVLMSGELGLETDTGFFKFGDGTTAWNSRPYAGASVGAVPWGAITGTLSDQTDLQSALNAKQATLVSGTSIKTINGNSLLGAGDLTISGGGGGITALTGDVTASGSGSVAATIAAGAVTVSKMADLAAGTILGNNTGGAAAPIALTAAQIKTMLAIAASDVTGLAAVATSGSASDLGSGTLPAARFDDTAHGNRSGGALHAVATGSDAGFMSGTDKTKLDSAVEGPASATDNAIARFDGTTGKLIESSGARLRDSGAIWLPDASPSVPDADFLALFAQKIAGRMMPVTMGPSGLETPLQASLGLNRVSWANPIANSTTLTTSGIALNAIGTAATAAVGTAPAQVATRRINYQVATPATNAIAGFRTTNNQFHIGDNSSPFGGFFYACRFGRSTGAAAVSAGTLRGFTGFTSNNGTPTDADPSAGTGTPNILGVGFDAGDTNYQIMHRTGTGTTVKVDTGIAKADADATEMYELLMFTAPTGTPTVGYRFRRQSDGVTFAGLITADLPAPTTMLSLRSFYSVGGTSSVIGYSLGNLYVETDY